VEGTYNLGTVFEVIRNACACINCVYSTVDHAKRDSP
jgi:hypothetical protein